MKVIKSFVDFLGEYRIIALSIAFTVNFVTLNFVKSVVDDILLPLLLLLISSQSLVWEDMIWTIGSVNIRMGSFL